jgi:type I restriction enzyme, S subunit
VNEKGWEVKKLGNICDVRDGTHDSPKYHSTGYPLITSKNIKDGNIDFSDVNLISKEDFIAVNKRSLVDDGDILMPMIGTIGNPVIVKKDREFAIKNVALIKFGGSTVSNVYIKMLLQGHFLEKYIEENSK